MSTLNKIIDTYGRQHTYLRISLTEKCNLRCTYCMPAEGVNLTPRPQLMTAAEIETIAEKFVELGVTKIRLTGGEPLVRKDFSSVIHSLSKLPVELSMTSNGILLDRFIEDLKKADLKHINISLDTLDETKFQKITRFNKLQKVLDNIDLMIAEGFVIKLNVVLIKGFNDDEITDFIDFANQMSISVRFIEFMPFDGNSWNQDKVFPEKDLLQVAKNNYGTSEIIRLQDKENDTAHNYKTRNGSGSFAIISTVTNPFCDSCNRIRLTADGKIKNCLFSQSETNLLTALRAGKDISSLIQQNISEKKLSRGGLDERQDFLNPTSHVNRSMILIGG